jgi:hypothetical protein
MRKNNGKKARREAMRLVAYIRALGREPLPFNHQSVTAYRADLQRQYQAIRYGMDDETGREARLKGRALVRLRTLEGAAGDAVPANVPPPKNPSVGIERISQSQPQTPTSPDSGISGRTLRDVRNCKRKLRHAHFLSALHHAARLGDVDLHIYPCPVCSGLHVGHDRNRMRVKDIERELETIEERLIRLQSEGERLQARKSALLQIRSLLNKSSAMEEND